MKIEMPTWFISNKHVKALYIWNRLPDETNTDKGNKLINNFVKELVIIYQVVFRDIASTDFHYVFPLCVNWRSSVYLNIYQAIQINWISPVNLEVQIYYWNLSVLSRVIFVDLCIIIDLQTKRSYLKLCTQIKITFTLI